jgi:hypothetical protein
LFRCDGEPDKWCGDAAWFPAYPWVFGSLHQLGLPLRGTAVVVSWLFAAGTIVLLWATFLERRANALAVAALAYAAFTPGQIYHYSIFPISMVVFFTLACLWLVYRARYVTAGLAGAVAALAYPVGVLLAPATAIWLVAQPGVSLTDRLRRIAVTGGLTLLGFWVLVIDQYFETGRWDAFFLIQANYEELHGSENPFVATWDIIRGGIENARSGLTAVIALQTALVTVVLTIVVVNAIRNRLALASADALLLVWALATWVMLFQAFSLYRGQAVLLPVSVLVAKLPASVAWPLAGTAAVIAVWLERYFLNGALV